MAKVLVVDDSLSVRKVVERALLGRHIEVVCAATGSEALERIERDEPDVVVCDVVMPDRDGYEICDFVKRHPRLAGTPVLLMSGIVNDEVRQRAAQVRSADVLSKPFAADDLLRKLDSLLASASKPAPVSPSALTSPSPVNGNGHAHVQPAPMPVEPAPLPIAPAPLPIAPPPPIVTPPIVTPPPVPVAASVEPPLPIVRAPKGEDAAPAASRVTPIDSAGTVTASILGQFAAIEGVQWAVLADREGFLLEAAPATMSDPEVAGALSACLAESSVGLGRELGRGALHGMMLEYERGMVVIYGVGAGALLAIGLTEPAVLGKVRYYAKKSLPELLQAV
jgi:CheY-like chemotaxis protein/predicted regulator of Ras-like GTPase activity (Roadblock/LC7/MglB family)